jgi:hypothetical protein
VGSRQPGQTGGLYEPPSQALFGWISTVASVDLSKLESTHGLDVALLVRFLRSKVKLFFVLNALCCSTLTPLFYFGQNRLREEGDARRTVGIQCISIVNVDKGKTGASGSCSLFRFLSGPSR